MITVDCLVVGSGLTGAVIARLLAEHPTLAKVSHGFSVWELSTTE